MDSAQKQSVGQLSADIALAGVETVQAGLKAIQASMGQALKGAEALAGAFKDNLGAATKIIADSMKGSASRAAADLNDQLVKIVATTKRVSDEQARNLIKTEAARIKLLELTEQTVKFGLAAVDSVQRKAVGAWQLATTTMAGFATAGIHASYLGDVMALRLEILGRNIGGLVAPEFQMLIGLVERLTDWLRKLDPAQKETLARWIEMSAIGLSLTRVFGGWVGLLGGVALGMGKGGEMAGRFAGLGRRLMETMDRLMPALEAVADIVASTVNTVLGVLNSLLDADALRWAAAAAAGLLFASMAIKIVRAIGTIVTALKALTAAKIAALAFSGPAGWAQLAAAGAVAAAGLAAATKVFNAFGDSTERSRKKHVALREELAKKSSGLEALEATYARIAQASINVGRVAGPNAPGIPGQGGDQYVRTIAETVDKIWETLTGTKGIIERQKPSIGR